MFFTTFLKEKFGYAVFLLAIVYFLLLIRGDVIQNKRLEESRGTLAKDIELAKARQVNLKSRMNALKKNSYIEKMAREKLGLIERGESPYKVIVR